MCEVKRMLEMKRMLEVKRMLECRMQGLTPSLALGVGGGGAGLHTSGI